MVTGSTHASARARAFPSGRWPFSDVFIPVSVYLQSGMMQFHSLARTEWSKGVVCSVFKCSPCELDANWKNMLCNYMSLIWIRNRAHKKTCDMLCWQNANVWRRHRQCDTTDSSFHYCFAAPSARNDEKFELNWECIIFGVCVCVRRSLECICVRICLPWC